MNSEDDFSVLANLALYRSSLPSYPSALKAQLTLLEVLRVHTVNLFVGRALTGAWEQNSSVGVVRCDRFVALTM